MPEKTHFTKTDLAGRWGISRQLVNYRAGAHKAFPKPEYYLSGGRFPVYNLEDVLFYEFTQGIKPKEE